MSCDYYVCDVYVWWHVVIDNVYMCMYMYISQNHVHACVVWVFIIVLVMLTTPCNQVMPTTKYFLDSAGMASLP